MSKVSAIVVSYRTGKRLKECLYALVGDPAIDETVIVDNGNPAEMEVWLDRFALRRDVTLIRGHGNIGFGAGVNRGSEQASGSLFLIINPDAVLKRGSVERMIEASAGLTAPWIIGGKIFDTRGREEKGPRRRDLTLFRALTSFLGFKTWTLERTPPPDRPVAMEVISGALFLTSAGSFRQLGGFDERYFLHVEDVDLCVRCRALGGTVLYHPHAGALHYGATSDAPNLTVARHKGDSLALYFRTRATGRVQKALTEAALPFIRLALRLRA